MNSSKFIIHFPLYHGRSVSEEYTPTRETVYLRIIDEYIEFSAGKLFNFVSGASDGTQVGDVELEGGQP